MKTPRFFLTLLLGFMLPVLAKAQTAVLSEEYLGYYESSDQSLMSFFSVYSEEDHGFMNPTEDQKKKCAFVFGFHNSIDLEVVGLGVSKGTNYTSIVADDVPVLNFEFSSDGTTSTVVVTDKAGKKYTMNKVTYEVTYPDEEYSDAGYDEETGEGIYGDEENSDVPSVFSFPRSDGAELLIFMSEDKISFSVLIPASKTCPEVEVAGEFSESLTEANTYIYTSDEYELKAKMIEVNDVSGWQFSCSKGNCLDAKNKCGIWKAPFMMMN